MSLRDWWRNRSGKAKTVTVLCALLILQIGLCFGTSSIVNSYQAVFHVKPSANEEFSPSVGFMIIEAMLAAVTGIALLAAVGSLIVGKIVDKMARPKGEE